jgi:hypothetical protein
MEKIKKIERYITIEKYEKESDEYREALSRVTESAAWKFFLFDMKSTILGILEQAPLDQGKDYIGILKGIAYLEKKLLERVYGEQ